jgi:hypothetical protein
MSAKHYIAFRHIFEAVPKWEKERFIQVCMRLVSAMQYQKRWVSHTYSQSILILFEQYYDSDLWWQDIKQLSTSEFFVAFLCKLESLDCVHRSPRTPVQWCSICLGVAAKK